jgi:S-DNA-T family DNA segregation ATPase FtsK/SpoIIIE
MALALMGWAAYLPAVAIVLCGLAVLFQPQLPDLPIRLGGFVLFTAGVMLGLAILNSSDQSTPGYYKAGPATPGAAGGVLGVLLAGKLYVGVGAMGAWILFLLTCAVGALLLAGPELVVAYHWVAPLVRKALGSRKASQPATGAVPEEPETEDLTLPEAEADEGPVLLAQDEVADDEEPAAEEEPPVEEEVAEVEAAAADAAGAEAEGPEEAPEEAPPEPELIGPVASSAGDEEEAEGEDDEESEFDIPEVAPQPAGGEYHLPPVRLLSEVKTTWNGEDEAELREKGRVLARTLAEFKVEAQVVSLRRGPVITMYELSLAPGTKVSKVESLADDLAIALKAPNVRIVAPLPGRNTIGIEVPNSEREVVGVRELMEETSKKHTSQAIPLFLGKDTAGKPLVLDLARCPHLMVAGATGSGKSVAVNAMICSILMTATPDDIQLLLIDPKAVEFSLYRQLPHLICPVLTDMKKAASVLKWACKKMDQRYSLLARTGVRDLAGYNALGEEEIRRRLDPEGDAELDDVPFHMPHIVIIVDEFGELMMVAAKEVEHSVIRLSQKARAIGIHLICATQRPSVDVITGLIKANMPARVAFQVASKVDSRTILDRNGAEVLLGRGDMLLMPPDSSALVRAQGAYLSEEEIARVVGFWEAQGEPQFRADLREYHAQQEAGDSSDELFEEAVRIVLETQRGSVSLLQRRLSVGYSRAARLIDMMAEAGIVGSYRGSQARRVMMTLEEWDKAHAQQQQQQQQN